MLAATLAVVLALLQAAPAVTTFSGVVTDSECAEGDHSGMRMGDTAAECARACVDYHQATLLLRDGTTSRRLDNQKAAAPFAGQRVTVVGTLDEATGVITVQSISPAR